MDFHNEADDKSNILINLSTEKLIMTDIAQIVHKC